MTDKERFIALMTDFQVPITSSVGVIVIEAEGNSSMVKGYMGFIAEFSFTSEGKFVSVGIWE